jgi:hypothetical protein
MSARRVLVGVLFVVAFVGNAQAGSLAGGESVFPLENIAALSKKVERVAAERGARVFLLGRVGRPEASLPDGIEYTHISFGVYSSITTEDGRTVPGYAIHNLYQDAKRRTHSALVKDYPIDFLAAVQAMKVGVIIPKPELQKRLLAVLTSDTYEKLHNPNYSALSNPFNTKFQNCTEHTLDVINAAIYGTDDIEQLKENARAYFQPQQLKVSPLKLFFAQMFQADMRTSDQKGPIKTATSSTIANYLQEFGLVEEVLAVTL